MKRLSSRGSSLVELAIALPVLLLIFFGTVDFARVMHMTMALNNAARAGAQFGASSVINSGNVTAITATANAASPYLGTISTSVAAPTCFCTDNSAVHTSTVCSTACGSGLHLAVYVTVTTSKTFAVVVPFPGLPTGMAISRGATMRVE